MADISGPPVVALNFYFNEFSYVRVSSFAASAETLFVMVATTSFRDLFHSPVTKQTVDLEARLHVRHALKLPRHIYRRWLVS